MAAKDHINRDLFHASNLPEEEFMKAPAIHVGTYGQAMKLAAHRDPLTAEQKDDILNGSTTPEEIYEDKIHGTPLSEHAKIFPVTLPDDLANRVHYEFLKDRGIDPPPSVERSIYGSNSFTKHLTYDEKELLVNRGLAAMNRNEVIRYVNEREISDDEYAESEPHSFLVPSPTINLSQMSQRVLPMDYSGVVESDVTRKLKEGKLGVYHWIFHKRPMQFFE